MPGARHRRLAQWPLAHRAALRICSIADRSCRYRQRTPDRPHQRRGSGVALRPRRVGLSQPQVLSGLSLPTAHSPGPVASQTGVIQSAGLWEDAFRVLSALN
ncbi:hypothetical protein MPL1032_20689 [Mesorhizobium plurifarium]|uniref:Uncharacterized protein n=1 Tax=Mesorhizobium plurifarium TaxID=69974 RepID=A0A0K2VYE8_MESPL|nr:hypothetical protein MPL1032_20689 [Mesorhizobium plurifarium]